ncbi:MAG: hypothetical protein MAG794_00596 [Gammaproteobacteria bacterium]|nr:hypothetical protein [Gammaproteobacteria bacterium]
MGTYRFHTMFHRFVILNALLLSLVSGQAVADQNAEGLDKLFGALATAEYRETALRLEREIWRVWLDSGDDRIDREMKAGIRTMSGGRLESAIRHFTRITEMAPKFAEGWNKRATAYYLNDELARSMHDIQKTLRLEPRHFGAIAGMGLIFLRQGDEHGAMSAFEQVLKIYPSAPGANAQVKRLRKKLKGQSV